MQSEDPPSALVKKLRATRDLYDLARDDVLEALFALKSAVAEMDIKEADISVKHLKSVAESMKTAAQQAIKAEESFANYSSDKITPIGNGTLDLDSAKRDILERLSRIAEARRD